MKLIVEDECSEMGRKMFAQKLMCLLLNDIRSSRDSEEPPSLLKGPLS